MVFTRDLVFLITTEGGKAFCFPLLHICIKVPIWLTAVRGAGCDGSEHVNAVTMLHSELVMLQIPFT